MGKVLGTTVVLTDEVTGAPIVLDPGTKRGAKHTDRIDNPKVWVDSDKLDDEEAADEAADEVAEQVVDGDEADQDEEQEDDVEDDATKPPAKNAKVEVWAEYAASRGVELGDDATKKDYQDAVAELDA